MLTTHAVNVSLATYNLPGVVFNSLSTKMLNAAAKNFLYHKLVKEKKIYVAADAAQARKILALAQKEWKYGRNPSVAIDRDIFGSIPAAPVQENVPAVSEPEKVVAPVNTLEAPEINPEAVKEPSAEEVASVKETKVSAEEVAPVEETSKEEAITFSEGTPVEETTSPAEDNAAEASAPAVKKVKKNK